MTRYFKHVALFFLFLSFTPDIQAQWLRKTVNSDYLYEQAKVAMDRKEYPRAIALCKQAINVAPRNLDLHLLLGRAYLLNNRPDSAQQELRYVIDKNPRYRDAHISIINLEIAVCNYPEALTRCDIALYHFPGDTLFRIKKMEVLDLMDNRFDADKISEDLLNEYPNNRYITNNYVEQHLQSGRIFARRGFLIKAQKEYELALEQDPSNQEALEAIYNLDIRSGNYESSLNYVNQALRANPNSYELRFKKVGILEELFRYPEALAELQKLIKVYPNDSRLRQTEIDLRMASGRFYVNTDPYLQFQSVLDRQPGNREALNYVINLASSRGLYPEALSWVNRGLRTYPNDPDLIAKKIGILENMRNYTEAAALEELRWRRSANPAERGHYLELKLLSGRQYMQEMRYDSAMIQFRTVLQYEPNNLDALNYAINLLNEQKRYDEALTLIDQAMARSRNNEEFALKKIGVLESYGRNAEAADVARQLYRAHPNNRRYMLAYIDASLASGRDYLNAQDYDNAIGLLHEVLDAQPENVDALNYMINLQSALQRYDSAMYYVNEALQYHPDSREFLFRKSVVYADMRDYHSAYDISGSLYSNYPYNTRYRQAYIDQLLASGRQYSANGNTDSALSEYRRVLAVMPNDSNGLYYVINIYDQQKKYDSALYYTRRARIAYPTNQYFILRAAQLQDDMRDVDAAFLTSDTLRRLYPNDPVVLDYYNYIQTKQLRNEIGLFYLQSRIVTPGLNSNNDIGEIAINSRIVTLQYTRYFAKYRGNIQFRLNYAGRLQGVGLLGETELVLNHTPKWYSDITLGLRLYQTTYAPPKLARDTAIVAGYSGVFPLFRLNYSLYHTFPKGYEGEIGFRYIQLQDSSFQNIPPLVGGVLGVSKGINDFWFNLRGFGSFLRKDNNVADSTYFFPAVTFTTRYYLNQKTDYTSKSDYVFFQAGYGLVPDDRSIIYFRRFTSIFQAPIISVGAGFQKSIKYRTIVGASAAWYNQQRGDQFSYFNQYDFFLYIRRKF